MARHSLSAMRPLTENPALALQAMIRRQCPRGMLRWDRSGRALLVSDAPRREEVAAQALLMLPGEQARVCCVGDLLYIDLPRAAYRDLLGHTFGEPGPWRDAWFAEQALLAGILARRQGSRSVSDPDEPLLRAAMLACAQGETRVRAFCAVHRAADATALRRGDAMSSHACAALVAHWLFTEQGVGMPDVGGLVWWDGCE